MELGEFAGDDYAQGGSPDGFQIGEGFEECDAGLRRR